MTTTPTSRLQSKELENLLTLTFNGEAGVGDRLLNHAYNTWLNSFTDESLGAWQRHVDAASAVMEGLGKMHGGLNGYINHKNEQLRDIAKNAGLSKSYEIELDSVAVTEMHELDHAFRKKGKLNNRELEVFASLFLMQLPGNMSAAKSDTEAAISKHEKVQKDAPATVHSIAPASPAAPGLAA
jgi:hypothetical protein